MFSPFSGCARFHPVRWCFIYLFNCPQNSTRLRNLQSIR